MSSFARLHHHLCRLTLLLAALLPAVVCAQTTHQVPQDFPTIQAAINASAAGDTISVAPGTYTENLVISGTAVHLVSTTGPATTILDGSFNGPVITITGVPSMATTVTGFTIQHGFGVGAGFSAAGVLLRHSGGSLSSNQFVHNDGDNIGVVEGTVFVTNNSISTAPSDRGAGNNCDGGDGVSISSSTPVLDSNGQPLASTITSNTIFGDSTRCSGTGITLGTVGLTSPHLIANNIIRNSARGLNLAADDGGVGGVIVRQNLIYDNANGAMVLSAQPIQPSTDPAIILIVNNTMVNNLNQPASSPLTEIKLIGTVARTAFLNNILVGTTANPVLTCDTGTPTYNNTPLILDHTDLYNTTQSPGGLVAGDCFTGISSPLASNGSLSANSNLSVDPRLSNSTDLHLAANSPAIDAGTNSAPSLTATDLDGNPRILDATGAGFATVDLGAYEYAGSPDSGTTAISLTASTYFTAPATISLTAVSTAPDGTHPAGTIIFAQNGTPLTTPTPVHTDATGTATLPVPLSIVGVVAFTASFTPDAPSSSAIAVAPTISPVLYVDVTAAGTTATSTLSLSASPTSLTTAESTTLTAHLGTSNDGNVIPDGTVSLTDNGTATANFQPDSTTGLASITLANLSAGSHVLVATYAGSSSFTPASATTALTVAALLPSTLTITATSQSGFSQQPLLISIHLGSLTTTHTSGPIPPGAVTLYSNTAGSSVLTRITTLQPDSSGNVTYTIADPPSGSLTYTVRFAGDTIYAASSASTGITLLPPATTAETLTANPNPATLGSTVALTATVTNTATPAFSPTGSVRFTDGSTLLGTVTTVTGTAGLSVNNLALGLHRITATFIPSAGFTPCSSTAPVTILRIPTSTTLTSSQPSAGVTDIVRYTATVTLPTGVTSPAPTGTITLSDGAAVLASGPLTLLSTTSSAVTFTVADPAIGIRILLATYTPAPAGLAASNSTLTQTITAAPTPSITLAATPNPATITSQLTLTTTLANAPSGATLALLDGATPLPLAPTAASATYTLAPGTLTIGTHTLSAVLRDAHANLIASSTPVTERITGLTSTLGLTASPAPSALVAIPVTLSVTVSSTIPTGHTPTGTVTFFDGSLVLGSTPIDASGHASLTTSTLSSGTHTLSASWSGDDLLSAAIALPLTEQILVNPTTTALTIANPASAAFAAVTLTAQVHSSTGIPLNTAVCTPACAPTAVAFLADNAAGHTSLGTVSVDATGRASLTLYPEAGPVTFSASFSGSPLFGPSTSPAVPANVTTTPTALAFTGSPNPLYQRGSVTLTASLSAAPGVPATALAGTITLLEGTTPLGTITSPTGTYTYAPVSPGTHTLTATFTGTADLAPSSATLVITVLPSDFTLTLADTALSIPTEHHTSTTATVAVTGDLADTIDLTCDNPPALVSCTFTPASMTLTADGNAIATSQLIVDTDFIQRWANLSRPPAFSPPGRALPSLAVTLALFLPAGWLLAIYRRPTPKTSSGAESTSSRRSPLPNLLAALLLSAVVTGITSCGGTQPGHTPPGTYTLSITAHARTHQYSHTAAIVLTVTP